MKGKKVRNLISLLISILIFGFIIWYIGIDSFVQIYHQIKPIYLIPYVLFIFLTLSALAGKLQFILKTHKQKIPFLKVLKYTIAGFAVSYLTPTARVGGEPIKTYMMKKEYNVPLKIGGSSVIIDKFIELLGSVGIAIIGLLTLFLIPGITLKTELILIGIVSFLAVILGYVYILTIKKKGPFTTILTFLRFYRFKKFKKYKEPIKEIEKRMETFFREDKKSFIIGILFYALAVVFGILEFKFLLLALGLNATILEIILFQIMLGITNLIPVPAGLGFQEIGQSGLFKLFKKGAGAGLFFSLVIRIRNLIITGIGFIIIANFGSKEISKKYLKNGKK